MEKEIEVRSVWEEEGGGAGGWNVERGRKKKSDQDKLMIEVFKTNVHEICEAQKIIVLLLENFTQHKINFDLHDCDKILRVVYGTQQFEASHFKNWLTTKGCQAEILPDF